MIRNATIEIYIKELCNFILDFDFKLIVKHLTN